MPLRGVYNVFPTVPESAPTTDHHTADISNRKKRKAQDERRGSTILCHRYGTINLIDGGKELGRLDLQ